MKRLLQFALLASLYGIALSFPGRADAAWTVGVSPVSGSSGAGAMSIALTISPGTGHIVPVAILWRCETNTISNVTDNQSDTYAAQFSISLGDTHRCMALYRAYNIVAGVTTVTVNFSGSTIACAIASDYAGERTATAPDDTHTSAANTGTGTSQTSNSITTTATDLVLGLGMTGYNGGSVGTLSAAGAYSLDASVQNTSDGMWLAMEHQINVAAGTFAAAFSTSGSTGWAALAGSFLPGGTGGSVSF